MTHEFEDANLAFTRDLFVFMNFTALSFVDLKELRTTLWRSTVKNGLSANVTMVSVAERQLSSTVLIQQDLNAR